MSSNLVIVAVPDENDRVWKVSSEKVPHLTLLFLGDSAQVSNLESIMQFVEHAADTMLTRFYLPVDRRDVLGADNADVLFFKKGRYDFKAVREFRAALLQDSNIKTAYDSATQFEGPWLPHLTLGYPALPAKSDSNEHDKFYDVAFNKIAVWTGDFQGPEFLLKDYWDEGDDEIDAPVDLAMSNIDQERVAAGLAALEHVGVKGMKWGVRNAVQATGRAAKKVGRGLAAMGAVMADSAWQGSTYNDVKHEAVHNNVAKKLDNHIERLQRAPKYRGKDLKADSDLRKTYYQDVAKVTNSAYRSAVKETYGENYTGTKSAHYANDARGQRIEVRNKKTGEVDSESPLTSMKEIQKNRAADAIGHAASTDFPDLTIDLTIDADGQISGVGFVPPSGNALAQTAIHGEAFVDGLVHFGIRGMKWGVRKPPPEAVSPKVTSKVPHGAKRKTKLQVEGGENHPAHSDAIKVAEAKTKLAKSGPAALSNQELRDVANRVQLEQQVKQLVQPKGKKFVKKLLGQQGNQAANEVVNRQVKKKLATAALL